MRYTVMLVAAALLAGCNPEPMSQANPDDANVQAVDNQPDANVADANAVDMNMDMNAVDMNADMTANTSAEVPDNAASTNAGTPADSGIEKGQGSFIDPGDMEVGSWHTLEFVVGADKQGIENEAEGRPMTTARPIYVAPVMRVTLLDDKNFEVAAKTKAIQETGADKAASWQWNVKPLTDGTLELQARVEVLQPLPNGQYDVYDQYTRRVTLNVEVGTWEGFLNALRNASTLGDVLGTLFRSWERTLIALTALVVAAIGLWAVIRGRK